MSPIYDVVIIGGGPAGLFAAYKLASAKLSVIVIEANKEIKRKICGEYLCPKGVELLREEGFDDFINQYLPLYGMKMFSPKGRMVESTFPKKNSKDCYGISINREAFEKYLCAKATSEDAEVKFGEHFYSAEYKTDYVKITTSLGEYRARFLIGADGRQSKVAKNFNLDEVVSQKRVAVHAYYKPKKILERYGQMHIYEDGAYIGVNPIKHDEVNVSLVCDAEAIKQCKDIKGFLNKYIEKSKFLYSELGLVPQNEKVWTVYPIQHTVKNAVSSYYALIGDAAGFLDPLTGEGIYNALITANILSEELIAAAKVNLFNLKNVSLRYLMIRQKFLKEKIFVNKVFQKVIRNSFLVEIIAIFLSKKSKRANAFIGIIGNIYRPFEGFLKMIL